MGIHTKKRRLHQANFLLLHCYENALRSVLAVHIANLHNVSCDDWFCKKETNNDKLSSLLKLLKTRKKYLEKQKEPENTWQAFDYFSLLDLERL